MRSLSEVRATLLIALVVGLIGAGAALAGRGDPQERITPADQARAKSVLVRLGDMNAAFRDFPTVDNPNTPYCAALDESDLTVTGQANSATFVAAPEFVVSRSYVYESLSDANASWRRGTSSAGQACLRQLMHAQVRDTAVRLVSFKPIPFVKAAKRTAAFRIVASRQGIRVYLDLIALQHGRAQVSIVYGNAFAPPPTSEEARLARLVARRMARAMRTS
jgi:hypothetical protein